MGDMYLCGRNYRSMGQLVLTSVALSVLADGDILKLSDDIIKLNNVGEVCRYDEIGDCFVLVDSFDVVGLAKRGPIIAYREVYWWEDIGLGVVCMGMRAPDSRDNELCVIVSGDGKVFQDYLGVEYRSAYPISHDRLMKMLGLFNDVDLNRELRISYGD
jgi:hypothetical protein